MPKCHLSYHDSYYSIDSNYMGPLGDQLLELAMRWHKLKIEVQQGKHRNKIVILHEESKHSQNDSHSNRMSYDDESDESHLQEE